MIKKASDTNLSLDFSSLSNEISFENTSHFRKKRPVLDVAKPKKCRQATTNTGHKRFIPMVDPKTSNIIFR